MRSGPQVLVGGSGFIGAELGRQLLRGGEDVRIADLLPSAAHPHLWAYADVRDADGLARVMEGAGTLFLLAAEHGLGSRPRRRYEDTNVGGARAVVAAARGTGLTRIVFTSSVAVYGRQSTAATEESSCRPSDDYGHTKLAAEGILRTWAAEDATRSLAIIRPTVVFGSGIRGGMTGLFHHLIEPDGRLIGSGRNRKSFAHVENLAAFHAHASRLGPGTHLFNYADGPDLTVAELAAVLRRAVGLSPPHSRRSRLAALSLASLQQLRAACGGPSPRLTIRQVRSLCADARFLAPRLSAIGFEAPLTLIEALQRYARTDLRWTAKPRTDALPTHATDDASAA